jgi:hypothetical protein
VSPVVLVLLIPGVASFPGAEGAAVAPPAEEKANTAAVDRLMRLVARVLVMVIAVLCGFGERGPRSVIRWLENTHI